MPHLKIVAEDLFQAVKFPGLNPPPPNRFHLMPRFRMCAVVSPPPNILSQRTQLCQFTAVTLEHGAKREHSNLISTLLIQRRCRSILNIRTRPLTVIYTLITDKTIDSQNKVCHSPVSDLPQDMKHKLLTVVAILISTAFVVVAITRNSHTESITSTKQKLTFLFRYAHSNELPSRQGKNHVWKVMPFCLYFEKKKIN